MWFPEIRLGRPVAGVKHFFTIHVYYCMACGVTMVAMLEVFCNQKDAKCQGVG